MYKIELQWKTFNISLSNLDQQLRSMCHQYVGNQAHSLLELWFSEEPSDEDKALINDLWQEIDQDHELAVSYVSSNDIKQQQQVKRESAKAKLAALGLDADELSALLG